VERLCQPVDCTGWPKGSVSPRVSRGQPSWVVSRRG
jgi:hypothetical protein